MSSDKRTGSDDEFNRRSSNGLLAVETIRSAGESAADSRLRRTDEERMSLFWRVFGGTIISVVALVGITIYNNLSSSITELRGEVSRLNEAKAEAAKKDELNTLRTQVATHNDYRREIDSLKERMTKHRGELDEVRKESAAHLEVVKKEQTATNDAIKKDVAALDVLKEKVGTVTADAKGVRDDLTKLRGDVDKNQAYDLERRDRRDSQMKQLDETLKEIQKNLLEAREKIARLEGQQGPAKPAAVEPAKPVVSAPPASKAKQNSGPRPVTPGPAREEK